MRDARGRITVSDPRYGRICECGNLKGKQAILCRQCYVDSTRDEVYWQRRTCGCGGPKSPRWARCRRCANALMAGRPRPGRKQPASHPWQPRKKMKLAA